MASSYFLRVYDSNKKTNPDIFFFQNEMLNIKAVILSNLFSFFLMINYLFLNILRKFDDLHKLQMMLQMIPEIKFILKIFGHSYIYQSINKFTQIIILR